jgi:hypothetical protein
MQFVQKLMRFLCVRERLRGELRGVRKIYIDKTADLWYFKGGNVKK